MMKDRINELKRQENAAILAHYYVDKDIQALADYTGDSFYLAEVASKLKVDCLIVAGVYFMGESIKILNPEKQVYMIETEADCPMAHMVTVADIMKMREAYEDLSVVCYVNSTAEIKAHSDVCVTSSNAVQIVQGLKEKNIYFIPDENLGAYVKKQVPNKHIILHSGYCPVHHYISTQALEDLKAAHPKAKVLAHPECPQRILDLADFVGSTKGIIHQAGEDSAEEFIIMTESGISYALESTYPNKTFYYLEEFVCQDMKKQNREKLLACLENRDHEVIVDEGIARAALKPLEKMLLLGGKS